MPRDEKRVCGHKQTVETKTKCVADVGDSGRWEIVPVGARLLSEGGK